MKRSVSQSDETFLSSDTLGVDADAHGPAKRAKNLDCLADLYFGNKDSVSPLFWQKDVMSDEDRMAVIKHVGKTDFTKVAKFAIYVIEKSEKRFFWEQNKCHIIKACLQSIRTMEDFQSLRYVDQLIYCKFSVTKISECQQAYSDFVARCIDSPSMHQIMKNILDLKMIPRKFLIKSFEALPASFICIKENQPLLKIFLNCNVLSCLFDGVLSQHRIRFHKEINIISKKLMVESAAKQALSLDICPTVQIDDFMLLFFACIALIDESIPILNITNNKFATRLLFALIIGDVNCVWQTLHLFSNNFEHATPASHELRAYYGVHHSFDFTDHNLVYMLNRLEELFVCVSGLSTPLLEIEKVLDFVFQNNVFSNTFVQARNIPDAEYFDRLSGFHSKMVANLNDLRKAYGTDSTTQPSFSVNALLKAKSTIKVLRADIVTPDSGRLLNRTNANLFKQLLLVRNRLKQSTSASLPQLPNECWNIIFQYFLRDHSMFVLHTTGTALFETRVRNFRETVTTCLCKKKEEFMRLYQEKETLQTSINVLNRQTMTETYVYNTQTLQKKIQEIIEQGILDGIIVAMNKKLQMCVEYMQSPSTAECIFPQNDLQKLTLVLSCIDKCITKFPEIRALRKQANKPISDEVKSKFLVLLGNVA